MNHGPSVPKDNFEDWYPAAHGRVLAALVAYSGDSDRAADATDEAFARALSKWKDVQLMDSPTGWTFVVARNVLRHRIRAARQEEDFVADAGQHRVQVFPDPSEAVTDAIAMAQVLRSLTRRQRTMFVLHYGMDISQDHVANLMHVSRSTVASTLRDARHILQGDQAPRRTGWRRTLLSTDVVLRTEETKNA